MAYNKKELLNLPAEEKLELAEALWNSIDDNAMPVTKEEIAFAEERYKMHLENPEEGMTRGEFEKKIKAKYGF
jgi:putative addiction module component (TIGR02574 family)